MITSKTNPKIKKIRSLQERKFRNELGIFWAEGKNCVDAALNSDWEIQEVAVSDDALSNFAGTIKAAEDKNCKIVEYSRDCFNKFSVLKHPEGIGAVVRKKETKSRSEINNNSKKVVLFQLQSPGNMGSIIRSAVAFGFNDIFAVEPSVDFFHPMTVRATSGEIFSANLCFCSTGEIKSYLDERKEIVAVLTADGKNTISSEKNKSILVVGNEPHGLPEEIRNRYESFSIKMENNVESLNVNAAAAIALYEMRRKD